MRFYKKPPAIYHHDKTDSEWFTISRNENFVRIVTVFVR